MNKQIQKPENVSCTLFSLLLALFFFVASPLFANEAENNDDVVVSGVVIDKKTREPLVGASVGFWKGGKQLTGRQTNLEGAFKLISPSKNFDVKISYMGYITKTIKGIVKDTQDIVIELEQDTEALNEVVVTGFVTKNKQSFTGAVTQISSVELKQVSNTNVISAIAALTPGMSLVQNTAQGSNPNNMPELVLRGMTSFSQDGQSVNQPTIILDGSEISMQDLYDLDINEIENITVLKDASATALYGAKASNGVIVITRKPIAEGSMRVQYNFTGNVQFPMLGDYNLLNAAEKLEYERLCGLYNANGDIDKQYELDNIYNNRFKAIRAGQNSDWLAQPSRVAFSHDHSVRIYGGVNKLRYELTGRFGNTQGVMKDDYRSRKSLGFKLDYYVNSSLHISNRTTYSVLGVKDSPYGSFSQYTKMNPYDRMYNADGTVNTDLSWDLNNPLYEATIGNYSKNGSATFSNTTDMRWDISKMFILTGHFNIGKASGWSEAFTSPKSLTYKDETDLNKKGAMYTSNSDGFNYSGNIVATFNKMFKDESLISLSAGGEINHSSSNTAAYQAIGFFNDKMSFIGSAASYPTTGAPSSTQAETADIGAFLTGNVSFRNRYFADATWRLTGSSLFGDNNRYGNFWSAGAGWNVINESFMKNVKKHFDLFKIRGSLGYTGKVSFNPYQAMTMYEYSSDNEYKNGIGAIPITIGDIDLCWERTMNYNVGLDLSLFDRRLNVVLDAYIRNTTDMLLDVGKAPSTGVTSAKQNLGEMQNKGFEFQVDGYVFRNNDFYWKLGTMGYINSNKITKINKALEEMNENNAAWEEYYGTKPYPQYAEGESVTALKLVRSAGIDPATGKEVYIKKNGEKTFEYDVNDKVIIGDTEPAYTGSVNTSLYWKGFSVYALFSFRMGAWVYNSTRASKVEGTNPMMNADQRVFADRWKKPGDLAIYKDIADTSTPKLTDRFAEKENTLTLSSLNISYEFDKKLCKKMKMRNLRAGINFTDILRFSTVKIERGTDYLYSQGFEVFANIVF